MDKDGTIYVDLTGKFPIRSMDGMTDIFILYDWTTNAILAKPIKNAQDETMVKVFKKRLSAVSNQYLTSSIMSSARQ